MYICIYSLCAYVRRCWHVMNVLTLCGVDLTRKTHALQEMAVTSACAYVQTWEKLY